MIAQLVVNGIVLGCIIALAAIGLSMTYRILNFANFAHGDFLTTGAYIALLVTASSGLGFAVSSALAIAASAVIAVALDFVIWKPMRSKGANRTSLMILSIGLALIIRNLLVVFFGPDVKRPPLPISEGITFAGVSATEYQMAVVAVALAAMFAIHYALRSTSMGKAMRALSDDPNLARISGIDVDRIVRYTWAIGIGLAALAGIMYGVVTHINPNMGWFMILPVFAAAILGGIGNPYGAMAGGMVIGLSQEISTAFIPSEYKIAVSFLMMIAVLFMRPEGIMGGKG